VEQHGVPACRTTRRWRLKRIKYLVDCEDVALRREAEDGLTVMSGGSPCGVVGLCVSSVSVKFHTFLNKCTVRRSHLSLYSFGLAFHNRLGPCADIPIRCIRAAWTLRFLEPQLEMPGTKSWLCCLDPVTSAYSGELGERTLMSVVVSRASRGIHEP